jgi:hypothetical protein
VGLVAGDWLVQVVGVTADETPEVTATVTSAVAAVANANETRRTYRTQRRGVRAIQCGNGSGSSLDSLVFFTGRTPAAQLHPRSRPQISPYSKEVRARRSRLYPDLLVPHKVAVGTGESCLGRGMWSGEAMVVRTVPAPRVRPHAPLRDDASSRGTMRRRKARRPVPERRGRPGRPAPRGRPQAGASPCSGPRAASNASRRTPS